MNSFFLLGICGTAMSNLALLLKAKGYEVYGYDSGCYYPTSYMLEKYGIRYDIKDFSRADKIVVGNVISRGNEILEDILVSRKPYYSQGEVLYKEFLESKERIIIAGTHGKTTTSYMVSYLLESVGRDVSYFIGGVPRDRDSGALFNRNSKYFVVEGDEYDTAFFDKRSKFLLYRPHHLILTSLEYDHADIFKNEEALIYTFRLLLREIPKDGIIVYNSYYKYLNDLVSLEPWGRFVSFGEDGDIYINKVVLKEDGLFISGSVLGKRIEFFLKVLGKHNAFNSIMAIGLLYALGFDLNELERAISSFKGMKRRLEVLYTKDGTVIIDDFAHHPTAIEYGLNSLREHFKGYKLFVVFEPRSATSRRNVLQDRFSKALSSGDVVFIVEPIGMDRIPLEERLDLNRLLNNINTKSFLLRRWDIDYFMDIFLKKRKDKNIIVFMSNGDIREFIRIVVDSI